MGVRILITGGAGFVGSHLALSLKQNFPESEIIAMDNLYRKGAELNVPRLRDAGCVFYEGDIRQRHQFPDGPIDYVLECSAEPSVQAGYGSSPDYLIQTNLLGTYECLEFCRKKNAKLMFFSTSRVYPIAPLENHPWEETDTRFEWSEGACQSITAEGVSESLLLQSSGQRSLYGFTKYSSELLIEEYRQAFGLEAVINRCSVVAGPWQMGKVDQGVVGLWVMSHFFQQPLSYIGYGGSGKQVRDILHVKDLADLVERQIKSFSDWEGWCGNVGGGREISTSLCELTALCQEVTGNRISIKPEPVTRVADLRIFMADCSCIKERFGWTPQRSVRHIVEDVFLWLDENKELVQESLRPEDRR